MITRCVAINARIAKAVVGRAHGPARIIEEQLVEASLELADPVEQLAYEHGAGVVEVEVTA